MNKAQLIAAIVSYGETPPSRWGKIELQARLQELRQENGLGEATSGTQSKTPLQIAVAEVSRASRNNKAALQRYVEKELQLVVTGTETMAQLEDRAVRHLYQVTETTAQDLVGFGPHASLTYAQLLSEFPQYAEWVEMTSQQQEEAARNPRLHRLARWLAKAKSRAPIQSPVLKLKAKGDIPTNAVPEKPAAASPEAAFQTRASSSSSSIPMYILQNFMTAVQDLQKEVKELRGGRLQKSCASNNGH